jgi:hypothetical protein
MQEVNNFLKKKMVIFYNNKIWQFLFVFILLTVLVGLILPPQASAQIAPLGGPTLVETPKNVGEFASGAGAAATNIFLTALIKIVTIVFFLIPLLIGWLFFNVTSWILGWVISPDFISLSFTHNEFVNAGLSATRGLANIAFLVFLIAIALATALRIEEYKARKTLPILIIIALLINFSPVLCGVIIDASNVLMFRFLSEITGMQGFVDIFKGNYGQEGIVTKMIWSGWGDIRDAASILFECIAVIFFFLFAGYVFIVFSVVFTVRYIMLWILVILSPIAFVSYIFPSTRRGKSLLNWNQWWEQLVEWCIIGITCAFFLYLGFVMINLMGSMSFFKAGPEGLGRLNGVLPWFVPMVLLYIGYKELKKTTAMFAQGIIQMPEKIAKTAMQAAVAAGVAVATGGAGAPAALAPLTRATGALRERLERFPLVGQALGGPGAFRASQKKRTQAETKGLEDKDSFDLHATMRQTGVSTYKRSRAIGILAKRGDLEITPDEARQWLPEAERHGEDMREIGSVRPDYAPHIPRPRPLPGAPPPPPPPLGVPQADWDITQQVRRMKANKSRDINRLALENEVVVKSLNRDQIQDFTRSGSPQQKQNIVNTIRNITGAAPGPFAPVPAVGPPINGIDRVVINYIADQQVLGTWPA